MTTTPDIPSDVMELACKQYRKMVASANMITDAEIERAIARAIMADREARKAENTATQIGWAYQDKQWDGDRWRPCGWEKPRGCAGRRVTAIYILNDEDVLSAPKQE